MMRGRYLIIGLIIILGIFIIFGGAFFEAKLSFNKTLRDFFQNLSPYSDLKIRIAELERENEELKTKILLDETNPNSSVVVYASHPLNDRSEIAIAIGSDEGVEKGDAVTYGNSILVGRVKTVSPNISIVTTIFDPGFETPVRIGVDSVDALLKGGNELTLRLIAPDAFIENDSIVYTADPSFPYGLEIGRVRSVNKSEGGVFQKASVNPAFEIKLLRNVVVHK
ncbi:MAG: hypothetical protein COT89_02725 [Candidatus Colwellbacteria bacterium CG10_big_fil_rev_8_21_14_0_10_42_22]|uniref:Cell shape-determining protein MreC n=1 Tax=Candidatus Colwellbacteria bacterium CG10_big_fil_rev_8_21_14_0_10_42_22 TaxID=1974540 RepID=A0A2H0VHN7_9BACT|nr:MAG: hypothetical protein COT89_02725 [Candidatus Colwellbacteria bacterium CG10_big_fil_rev_8_21_14_0_10_42_22]